MNKELQVYNERQKLAKWAEKVSQCRESGLNVREWCEENGVNISTYYKWQRKIYALAKGKQEIQFAQVAPEKTVISPAAAAVSIRIGSAEAIVHNGADPATVESVLRILKQC